MIDRYRKGQSTTIYLSNDLISRWACLFIRENTYNKNSPGERMKREKENPLLRGERFTQSQFYSEQKR